MSLVPILKLKNLGKWMNLALMKAQINKRKPLKCLNKKKKQK